MWAQGLPGYSIGQWWKAPRFSLYCNSAIVTEWFNFTRRKAFNTQGLPRRRVITSHRPNSSFCLFNKIHKGILRRGPGKFLQSLLIWRESLIYGWGPLMIARDANIRHKFTPPPPPRLKLAFLRHLITVSRCMVHQEETVRMEREKKKKTRKQKFTALKGSHHYFALQWSHEKCELDRHCSFSHLQENHEQDSKQGTKNVISKNYYFAWNWFLSCVSDLFLACFFGYYLVCANSSECFIYVLI